MLNFVFYDATFPGRFEEGEHVGGATEDPAVRPKYNLSGAIDCDAAATLEGSNRSIHAGWRCRAK
jgi:hypothetical protein